MINIEILKVAINHIEALQNISRQTFFETFAHVNSKENMDKYLEQDLSIAKLTNEVNNTNSEFYFAKFNDDIIGYLKINYANSQTELQDKNGLEIERIYITKEFYGKNVGQKLYLKAIELAKQNNLNFVWLGVWEKNLRAIKFYKKNGFVQFDKHIFMLGNDKQTDILMKLKL